MNKSSTFIILILLFTFVSCKNESEKQEINREKTENNIPKNVDDDFSQFLKNFSKDSIFQISRVKFPLKVKEWENPEVGMKELVISKTKYTSLDFTYPEDAQTRESDRYSQKLNIKRNKCVVEIRGIDNGICTDFFFEKMNGKWFLVSWNEKST